MCELHVGPLTAQILVADHLSDDCRSAVGRDRGDILDGNDPRVHGGQTGGNGDIALLATGRYCRRVAPENAHPRGRQPVSASPSERQAASASETAVNSVLSAAAGSLPFATGLATGNEAGVAGVGSPHLDLDDASVRDRRRGGDASPRAEAEGGTAQAAACASGTQTNPIPTSQRGIKRRTEPNIARPLASVRGDDRSSITPPYRRLMRLPPPACARARSCGLRLGSLESSPCGMAIVSHASGNLARTRHTYTQSNKEERTWSECHLVAMRQA